MTSMRCSRQQVPLLKTILLPAALAVLILTFYVSGAMAQPNPALGNGVTCNDVGTNSQSSGVDPNDLELTDLPPAGGCPPLVDAGHNILVGYGFNYEAADVWYSNDGNLYVCVSTHGYPGDSDGNGLYNTQSATCSAVPAACSLGESDGVNVFAQGLEEISFLVDRNCDMIPDLKFAISGPDLRVTTDLYTGHVNENLGGQGTTWQAAPLFTSQLDPGFQCDPALREGKVIICIPNWNRYFVNPNPASLNLFNSRFNWIVDSGNLQDSYPEDTVPGTFDVVNPCIDLTKSADPTGLCGVDATTHFTLTISNCGNVPLVNGTLTDDIPTGLDYDNDFVDDMTHPIGAPSVGMTGDLTWTNISIPAGVNITVSFRAKANAECIGEKINSASVEAQYFIDCLGDLSPGSVGPVTKTAPVTCVQPCVTMDAIRDTTHCVGETVDVPVTVRNCSTVAESLTVVCTVDGVHIMPDRIFENVAADDFRSFTIPVTCNETGTVDVHCEVTANVPGSPDCSDTAMDTGTVTCREACAEYITKAPDQEICVGETATVPFTVRNCATEAESISVTCAIDGVPGEPQNFANVGPGGTETFNVEVECTEAGTHRVICVATATLKADPPACTAVARDTVDVTCLGRGIEITKTVTPSSTTDCSQVTIVVHNTGNSILDPVNVSDHLPADLSLTLNPGDLLGGTCEATVNSVTTMGDVTWLKFNPLTLDIDESCTIIYDICCTQFDGQARIDTAKVEAWCQGTYDLEPRPAPAADQDTAKVVCQAMGGACPHTIGFWRQQCAQKDNGSTKICVAGMEALWRCVISTSHVDQFKKNDGSFETRMYLAGLSDANLFIALCSQLQGPRPMTLRDMTEIQYLGLMLNVCVGSMPLDTPIDVGQPGINTVGDAIAAIENALNTNSGYDIWEKVADDLNNRLGVLAGDCADADSLYRERPECQTVAPAELGSTSLSITKLAARAFPNPVRNGATTIQYSIPDGMSGVQVDIQVFDVTGRLVKTVVSDLRDTGQYTVDWDLTDQSGNKVSAGLFFYTLNAGGEKVTEKMLVLQK